MNIYLILVLAIYGIFYLLDVVIELLNIKNIKETVPNEFDGVYEPKKYQESQRYLKETTRFSLIKSTIGLIVFVPFMLLGGFNYLDVVARGFGFGSIITGLIYIGILGFLSSLMSMPFSVYGTFVIEKKYGFNKTTVKTFVTDTIKMILLSVAIGAPILALVLWFFESFTNFAWLYVWGALTVIQVVLMVVAPIWIMPLFNKFIPLEEGDLRKSIEDYATKEGFSLQGIFKMDGSKRSTKSNAYFTGLGKYKRIVLFDTLIEKHSVNELVGIVAHEMGHFKHKHIYKLMAMGILTSGLMLYTLSLFLNNPGLFQAFQMEQLSIYASLIFFSFLFKPIELFLGIFSNVLSRKYEFEADEYAVRTTSSQDDMVSALKTLSVDNLSNLNPHPMKVFIEYSHPPVLTRIKAIKAIQ
ncbi:peptidase M48 [Candidatus Marinamargulisbacteria bacterium SCGC AG-410-N11]|nr:peptidase M48 [Candidatus Marinamargulisbacteria bacterium SCGC AG-410-N11]